MKRSVQNPCGNCKGGLNGGALQKRMWGGGGERNPWGGLQGGVVRGSTLMTGWEGGGIICHRFFASGGFAHSTAMQWQTRSTGWSLTSEFLLPSIDRAMKPLACGRQSKRPTVDLKSAWRQENLS